MPFLAHAALLVLFIAVGVLTFAVAALRSRVRDLEARDCPLAERVAALEARPLVVPCRRVHLGDMPRAYRTLPGMPDTEDEDESNPIFPRVPPPRRR